MEDEQIGVQNFDEDRPLESYVQPKLHNLRPTILAALPQEVEQFEIKESMVRLSKDHCIFLGLSKEDPV